MHYLGCFIGLALLGTGLAAEESIDGQLQAPLQRLAGHSVLGAATGPMEVKEPMSTPLPTLTTIVVQVIAKDGKFLGDDIGGAAITVRDAETREILIRGRTSGGSGPNGATGVMCLSQLRGQAIPWDDLTSSFGATLPLSSPRRIEVTAFGPLGARESAQTASISTWIYPGADMTAGNGILLEMPGLICQVISPPAHTTYTGITEVPIVANVAMMCGCPISSKSSGSVCPGSGPQPWDTSDFNVFAVLQPVSVGASPTTFSMPWDSATPTTAGRFTTTVTLATPVPSVPSVYELTVYAQQKSTGNTGVDFSSFIVSASS